jgi:phospholipase C
MSRAISHHRRQLKVGIGTALVALMSCGLAAAEDGKEHDGVKTATPIKHVIVLIGENRTFDNVYGTYVAKHGQSVGNLLSRGIVNANGTPGPHRDAAKQFRVDSINPPLYFISTNKLTLPSKTAYGLLPTPEAGGAPNRPVSVSELTANPTGVQAPFDRSFTESQLRKIEPSVEPEDLGLLLTGATGLPTCPAPTLAVPSPCPDTRVQNFNILPNTVFQITGPKLPYDSYTGDMVHRFFHMWQQSDCDVVNATPTNPSGCLNDLYPFVGIARLDDSGSNAMGFYNVQKGDASTFKRLADEFTMSDNFHQSVMGGTAVQHIVLGTGDSIFWEQFGALPPVPPANRVANPNPKSPTNNQYQVDQRFTLCGDETQPGIKPIMDYLRSLPWRPDGTASNCAPGRFYMINNTGPGFRANGDVDTAGITAGTSIPPSSLRTIGDALNEKKISWAYFGGGFNAAVRVANGSTDPFDQFIAVNYCDICNPFSYAKSIMGDPAQRAAHIKDAVDFLDALDRGRLPSVAFVKPDSILDGHPASSKNGLLEAMIENIMDKLRRQPELFEKTAFFITFDEGGGYWDSGFFQPIDFFGDGPRIPMLAISPFSRGGRVTHSYGDHASILKFIERNWGLAPLTGRSRDNLPNPRMTAANPYVPTNMPAIGDLFDMFDFNRERDRDR